MTENSANRDRAQTGLATVTWLPQWESTVLTKSNVLTIIKYKNNTAKQNKLSSQFLDNSSRSTLNTLALPVSNVPSVSTAPSVHTAFSVSAYLNLWPPPSENSWSPSWIRTSLWTGRSRYCTSSILFPFLSRLRAAMVSFTFLKRPSWLGNTSLTLAKRHTFLGAFSSFIKTTSFTTMLRWGLIHFLRS